MQILGRSSSTGISRSDRSALHAFVLAATLAFLSGCGSTVKRVESAGVLELARPWAMLPVVNYSETPQAGERVEAMLDTVLRKEGVVSLARYPPIKEDDAHLVVSERQRYEESLAWARAQQTFAYGVTGSVEEWRYKSGLDGEPAVGLTVNVVDLATGQVVWSASGSRLGAPGESLSGAALVLLSGLVDEMSVRR
jgi:hypothetical protein